MKKLTKKQQIKLLKDISYKLSYKLDNISWNKIYTNYLNDNIKEEKRHLQGKPDSCRHGLTANEAGTLFAVKQIIEFFQAKNYGLKEVYIPKVEDYLNVRHTVFVAYAIVANYNEEIKEALSDIDYMPVLNIDYVELVQTDNQGNKFSEYVN